MQFTLSSVLLGALVATASAQIASVEVYTDSGCGTPVGIFEKDVSGYHCFDSVGGNSINYLSGENDCFITTWSGNACQGSSFTDNTAGIGCTAVPFASISITC